MLVEFWQNSHSLRVEASVEPDRGGTDTLVLLVRWYEGGGAVALMMLRALNPHWLCLLHLEPQFWFLFVQLIFSNLPFLHVCFMPVYSSWVIILLMVETVSDVFCDSKGAFKKSKVFLWLETLHSQTQEQSFYQGYRGSQKKCSHFPLWKL